MRAKQQIWEEESRILLRDVLPLETPVSVSFEASSLCNLKCSYCVHGMKEKHFPQQLMDWEVFKSSVDSLKQFPQKVKSVLFSLNGEPATNQRLPEMIRYVKESGAAEKVFVFTNAVLLSPEFGREMVDAGLDVLRVSMQGLSDERYQELCGVKVDYSSIVEHVAAFYRYKEQVGSGCYVFVKIVRQSFTREEDEQKFYHDFGDICDQISVETIVPFRLEVDYEGQAVDREHNLVGQTAGKTDVCAQPFYSMYVHSDGRVTPCCIAEAGKLVIGDAKNQSLYDIWNSGELADIRKTQLLRKRYEAAACRECSYPVCGMQHHDRIDSIADQLYETLFGKEI